MNLENDIKRIEQVLAYMKKQLVQQNKLELKNTGYYLNTDGSIIEGIHSSAIHGATRLTKELAKTASRNMVARNRLEAHVHEIQGDGEGKYIIYNSGNIYSCVYVSQIYLGAVYMEIETAEILCEALNNGEIEL